MEEDVKHVSMGALQQFNLDLIQCELFANSEPVRGFEEGALQMCFADLRQVQGSTVLVYSIWNPLLLHKRNIVFINT
ncbi:exocyst complex component 6-like isoform X4 [Tachypleus tridentatus]|uniref:exocyst complex component 6-like isoform X4 n=1 Tax=Tachypleus tridentatus TaxID=6853 RepID=UPI003FD23EB3